MALAVGSQCLVDGAADGEPLDAVPLEGVDATRADPLRQHGIQIGNTILLAVACLAMIAAPFASDAPTMADAMEGNEDSATRDNPQRYNREKI
jgi:hypothetical protein